VSGERGRTVRIHKNTTKPALYDAGFVCHSMTSQPLLANGNTPIPRHHHPKLLLSAKKLENGMANWYKPQRSLADSNRKEITREYDGDYAKSSARLREIFRGISQTVLGAAHGSFI